MKINAMNNTFLAPRIKSLPKGLIYKVPKNDIYHLIETKTGNLVGKMYAFPVKNGIKGVYDLSQDSNVFRVYSLKVPYEHCRQGWGSYFMQFAKTESYRRNCEGRLYLVSYNSECSPHIFYKKLGLKAVKKSMDVRLDEYIKKGYSPAWLPAEEMYLPLEDKKSLKNECFLGFKGFVHKLKEIFKIDFVRN